jgi:hypothetical protein
MWPIVTSTKMTRRSSIPAKAHTSTYVSERLEFIKSANITNSGNDDKKRMAFNRKS